MKHNIAPPIKMKIKIELPEVIRCSLELGELAQWMEKVKTVPADNIVKMPTLAPVSVKLVEWPIV